MTMPEAVTVLSVPENFAREMVAAGYRDPQIESVTYDYELEVARLADPAALFGTSPDWASLSETEKAAVIAEVRRMADSRSTLPIPSTGLIAVARR
jgi:hypothetical protein